MFKSYSPSAFKRSLFNLVCRQLCGNLCWDALFICQETLGLFYPYLHGESPSEDYSTPKFSYSTRAKQIKSLQKCKCDEWNATRMNFSCMCKCIHFKMYSGLMKTGGISALCRLGNSEVR